MEELIKICKENGLVDDVIDRIISSSTLEKVKPKTVILDYGEKLDKIYYIVSGAFVTKTWNEEKQIERTIGFFMDSFQPFMTDVTAYFSGSKSENCIQSISESTFLTFCKDDLDKIAAENINASRFNGKLIIRGLIAENNFRIKLLTYSSKKFYEYLINNHPQIIKNIPSKDIASFLGISDVWMSNLKRSI